MQRTDAIVAIVGAVIVAIAVVGAALSGPVGASFAVTFETSDAVVGEGEALHQAEGVRDQFAFTVNETNATRLQVTVTLTFLAGPGAQAALDALITAPDGTTFEAQGEPGPQALGSPQASATATFDVPLGARPENRTLVAQDAEDALRQAAPPASNASWVGEWTLDVSATAGPTPFAQATTAWSATLASWRATAAASPAGGK